MGLCSPEAILVSLNELLSGAGPLGVASVGDADGVGAGAVTVVVGLAGGEDDWAVPPPVHPLRINVARQAAGSPRTLREV
jgi:hypothetical protein